MNKDKLLSDWLKAYQFNFNQIDTYYSHDIKILEKIKRVLKKDQYALSLHTGANLITSYVKTDEVFFYMDVQSWEENLASIKQKLGLKELVKGGNIHIIKPYYKTSTFLIHKLLKVSM